MEPYVNLRTCLRNPPHLRAEPPVLVHLPIDLFVERQLVKPGLLEPYKD
jgi:hypothetical protein